MLISLHLNSSREMTLTTVITIIGSWISPSTTIIRIGSDSTRLSTARRPLPYTLQPYISQNIQKIVYNWECWKERAMQDTLRLGSSIKKCIFPYRPVYAYELPCNIVYSRASRDIIYHKCTGEFCCGLRECHEKNHNHCTQGGRWTMILFQGRA